MDSDSGHHSSDDFHHTDIRELYYESIKLDREKKEIKEKPILDDGVKISLLFANTIIFSSSFIYSNTYLGAMALASLGLSMAYYLKKSKDRELEIQSLDKKIKNVKNEIKEVDRF